MRSTDIKKAVVSILEQEEAWAAEPSNVRGVDTGFNGLNDLTLGWRRGEMIVLGAYTSVGKSAIGMQFIMTAVKQCMAMALAEGTVKHCVVLFSPEMTLDQILKRQASVESGVSSFEIEKGYCTQDQRKLWREAMVRIASYSKFLKIFAGGSMALADIQGKVDELMASTIKPLFIAVDYIQRVDGSNRGFYEDASQISRGLKDMANIHDIPVMAMSQFSRPKDHDESTVPSIYQFKNSGGIENDADVALIVHRLVREETNKEVEITNAILKVEKNRHGPLGTVNLQFHHATVSFVEKV